MNIRITRHLVQFLANSGEWFDAVDCASSLCCYETYDRAREVQESFEQMGETVRVLSLSVEAMP